MQTSRPRARALGAMAATIAVLAALAVSTLPASAAGDRVLVFGTASNSTVRPNVTERLRELGYDVVDDAQLPGDLSDYASIWHVGLAPLTEAERARLAQFVEAGGGLHLTGEMSHSVFASHHASLEALLDVVLVGGAPDLATATPPRPYAVSPSALGDLAVDPNGLTSFPGSGMGSIADVTGSNIFVTGAGGVPTAAAWEGDDTVGGGRITLVMDTNWIAGSRTSTHPDPLVIENIQRFLHSSNKPPVVDAGPAGSGVEGSPVGLRASVFDADGDPVTIDWSWAPDAGADEGASCSFSDGGAAATTVTCDDDGYFVATITASDGVNAPVSQSTAVHFSNVAPLVTLNLPSDAVPVGVAVEVLVSHVDPGANDTHTCVVDWGDGSSGSCTEAHAYAVAGLYTVTATVTDDDGGAGYDSASLAVYDPSGGFVTGGGVAGGTPFGLVARYRSGDSVPSGHFRFGSFQATSFAWLVVDAATGQAYLAGTGTLDGDPVSFRLRAEAGRGRTGGSLDLQVDGVVGTSSGPQPVRGNLQVHAR